MDRDQNGLSLAAPLPAGRTPFAWDILLVGTVLGVVLCAASVVFVLWDLNLVISLRPR